LPFASEARDARLALDPYQPWWSDWQHGQWPVMPLGLPEAWAKLLGALTLTVGAAALGAVHPLAGLLSALMGAYHLRRACSRLQTGPEGLSVGGAWPLPWTSLRGVEILPGRQPAVVHLLVRGPTDSRWTTLPRPLVSDLRSHLQAWGVQLGPYQADLDRAYEVSAYRLRGAPPATLIATPLLLGVMPLHWALWWGLTLAGLLAALGATLRARVMRWSAPSVLAMTLGYGWLLLCLGLAASWLGLA
jgi:hypothetical protein